LIPYTRAALVVALALSGMSGCSALSDEDSGVLLQDDFSDPDSGWPRDSDREATLEYADEAYRILVKDPGNAQSSVFEVSKANTWGWSSAEVVILIVAAVLVLIAFVAYERSGQSHSSTCICWLGGRLGAPTSSPLQWASRCSAQASSYLRSQRFPRCPAPALA
jgi:hypothetical protein